MFTVRYALIPYMKQIRFVFKGSIFLESLYFLATVPSSKGCFCDFMQSHIVLACEHASKILLNSIVSYV